jgi:putative FmdB family regulatory protein
MSYILYDFECTKCSKVEERLVGRDEVDSQVCECGDKMERLMPAPRGYVSTYSVFHAKGRKK